MTRDDIIRMAREIKGASRTSATDGSLWLLSESHLERFAALVAAAEREACIELTDSRCQCAWLIKERGQV
jgi:hypothetical protein